MKIHVVVFWVMTQCSDMVDFGGPYYLILTMEATWPSETLASYHIVTRFFYSEELLDLLHPPSWRTTPCRLSATACSIHSQLPSISGGRLLHPQHEDAPCRGNKGPYNIPKNMNSHNLKKKQRIF